jgi:hypothetical protein
MAIPRTFLGPIVPLACAAVSVAIYACALDTDRYRWIFLPPLLFFQYAAFATSNHWLSYGYEVDGFWGSAVFIWTCQSFSVLYLEEHSLVESLDMRSMKRPWYWKSWKTWNNLRLIGTPREERDTPRSFYGSRFRQMFAIVRIAKIAVHYLLGGFVEPLVFPGVSGPFHQNEFDAIRQTYFRRILSSANPITARETALRAIYTVHWTWKAYTKLDVTHAALSILFVIVLRVDQPHEWPPIFGHLRDVSSLRGFWGKFCHRLVVLPYGNIGRCVAEKVLGFSRGSQLHKLAVAFVIFSISGLMHSAVEYQLTGQCGWDSDIWWFYMNFAASTIESMIWSKVLKRREIARIGSYPRLGLCVRKCLGYGWIFAFFFWSVPKWQYPKTYCLFAKAPGS